MPNIGAVLREEIARLSRRENRGQIDKTRKATTLHRREIAQLKRQVVALERQLKLLVRKSAGATSAPSLASGANAKSRFVAKGLRSQRTRLGLSAADFGRLVGVTAQSIYNWENGKARPRGDQLAKLAALRGVGKREVAVRLGQRTSTTEGKASGTGPKTKKTPKGKANAKGKAKTKNKKAGRASRKAPATKSPVRASKRKARSAKPKAAKAS